MPTQTCECIKVTYQLEGEEPNTEIGIAGEIVNGKNVFIVGEVLIIWSGFEWVVTPDDSISVVWATLSEDTPCPFGTFTIEEGSIFEAFEVQPCETEEDRIINCYRLTVWKEQCEYAKCILKYLTQLQFGINNCEALEKLKNKRRVLNILNCYDPRDILNNTTEYNSITYTEIKQLLNYL